MDVQVRRVFGAEVGVVENLARFYAYELSKHTQAKCPEEGMFFCRDQAFWSDKTNRFFLARVDRELAGFVVVDNVGANGKVDFNVAELLILPKFRLQGIGQRVACFLFEMFVGNWEVLYFPENIPASLFWRKVISSYTSHRYTETVEFARNYGREMVVQRFKNIWRIQ